MKKHLNEMTKEELWQLFPIFLVKHKEVWSDFFISEKKNLSTLLKQVNIIRIEHIGSTAIPNIYAKDIVDILIELSEDNLGKVANILESSGYILMSKTKDRISLNKGYTEDGFAKEVYHIHLRKQGDIDELHFRDYLIEYSDVAKEYEKLKLELWKEYEHDRDKYTNAKTDFIKDVTTKAKELYNNKY